MERQNNNLPGKEWGESMQLFTGMSILFIGSAALLIFAYIIYYMLNIPPNPDLIVKTNTTPSYGGGSSSGGSDKFGNLWKAPTEDQLPAGEAGELIKYGKDLIANTSKYFGPKGTVDAGATNGLNCQNCHLQAGTAPFGNNYGGVAATYPQVRPRSEKSEDIPYRINDCFQRSLNGKALGLNSKEMKAIKAYIEWLGKDVPKGKAPAGSGLIPLAYLNRAADPAKGQLIYDEKCARCHGGNGSGKMHADGISYEYPPVWGEGSYNVSAGLFRMEKMARFLKANMPFGVTYNSPQLSDEEAWDVAAYINSKPHPMKRFPQDWPNLLTKSVDVPFGPYADHFSEEQHKYGPYPPIIEELKKLKAAKKKGK